MLKKLMLLIENLVFTFYDVHWTKSILKLENWYEMILTQWIIEY